MHGVRAWKMDNNMLQIIARKAGAQESCMGQVYGGGTALLSCTGPFKRLRLLGGAQPPTCEQHSNGEGAVQY